MVFSVTYSLELRKAITSCYRFHLLRSASMVKWRALDPWIGLNRSDSKQYSNFELREKEDHES